MTLGEIPDKDTAPQEVILQDGTTIMKGNHDPSQMIPIIPHNQDAQASQFPLHVFTHGQYQEIISELPQPFIQRRVNQTDNE